MKGNQAPTTTYYAVRQIAEELGVTQDTVRKVLERYTELIIKCLQQEIPFSVTGLGKFYFTYRSNAALVRRVHNKDDYEDKVHKELKFQVGSTVKHRLQGWVHDLGMRNNLNKKELMRLQITPEEIQKTRRARILEEQRAMGFKPELLFDEDDLSDADRAASSTAADEPSVEEMLDRLGVNIKLKK